MGPFRQFCFSTTLHKTPLGVLGCKSGGFLCCVHSWLRIFSSVSAESLCLSTSFPASNILQLMSPLPLYVLLGAYAFKKESLYCHFSGDLEENRGYLIHLISPLCPCHYLTSSIDLPSSSLRLYIVYISAGKKRVPHIIQNACLLATHGWRACIVWGVKHFKEDGTAILKISQTTLKALQFLRADHLVTEHSPSVRWSRSFCLTHHFSRAEELAHKTDLSSTVCLGREANLEITIVGLNTCFWWQAWSRRRDTCWWIHWTWDWH